MKTKKFKKEKAITLVALIITIVVLLVLAMVSISLVINSGIITKSKSAVDRYSDEEIQEQIKLAYSEYQMAKYSGQTLSLDQALTNSGLTEKTITGEGPWTITVGEKSYTLATDGSITTGSGSGQNQVATAQALSTLTSDNYGDYIDLGKSIVGTSATTDDWRIIYSNSGKVYAILADYMPNDAEGILSNIDGINSVKNTTYNIKPTGSETLFNGLKSSEWKKLLKNELKNNTSISVEGAITKEMLVDSYNEKHSTNFDYDMHIDESQKFYNDQTDTTKGYDTLYNPHEDTSEGTFGYLLNNSHNDTNVYAWYVIFDARLYNDNGGGPIPGVAIRPIVILNSDIQVTSTTIDGKTVWSLVNN